jgi:hypothetical protein
MAFAKHETFHFREGWLFKGMAAIQEAASEGKPPTIFLDRDAPERLGIGVNMVRALRFWMQATSLAVEGLEARQRTHRLSPLGKRIWDCDPYLDDIGTLWLIHYQLVCSKDEATSWYWFFNLFAPVSFNDRTMLEALQNWVVATYPEQDIAVSSLTKDVECLLRTYLPEGSSHTPEDLLECPLARLHLLSKTGDGQQKRYHLHGADPARLHPLIVLYVLADQQRLQRPSARQLGLTQALRDPMNVGRVFGLTTTALTDLLAAAGNAFPEWRVHLERTGGLDQMTLPDSEPDAILNRYYEIQRSSSEGAWQL